MKKKISQVVIKRMPRYYRYLGDLLDQGIERISSKDLSHMMHVTASQIRQDLNNFGGFGQQGYGYNVQYLYDEIGKILGLDREHSMIVIGAGNMGLALASHSTFDKQGFMVRGIFDIRPELKDRDINGLKIQMMDELDEFVANHKVDIVALTVPKSAAKDITEKLVALGIKAIWNFTQTDLSVPKDVIVQNVHLADSLMRISLNMIQNESTDKTTR